MITLIKFEFLGNMFEGSVSKQDWILIISVSLIVLILILVLVIIFCVFFYRRVRARKGRTLLTINYFNNGSIDDTLLFVL